VFCGVLCDANQPQEEIPNFEWRAAAAGLKPLAAARPTRFLRDRTTTTKIAEIGQLSELRFWVGARLAPGLKPLRLPHAQSGHYNGKKKGCSSPGLQTG